MPSLSTAVIVTLLYLCAGGVGPLVSADVRPSVHFQDSERIHVETFPGKAKAPITPSYGWVADGRTVSPFKKIELTFALKHRAPKRMQSLFNQVSDPRSPHYRKFMSMSGIAALFAPTAKTVKTVTNWLVTNYQVASKDIKHTRGGEFLTVSLSVVMAEKMLHTSFKSFAHPDGARIIRALDKYTLPKHIADHIDFVGGVHRFPNRLHISSPRERSLIDKQRVHLPLPKGATAGVLPDNDAPIVLAASGAGPTVTAFILPRCSDKAVDSTGTNKMCPGNTQIPLTSFTVTQVTVSNNKTAVYNVDPATLNCNFCSEFTGSLLTLCTSALKYYGIATPTTVCLLNIEDVAPFKAYTYTYQAIYHRFYADAQSTISPATKPIINHPWIDVRRLYQLYNVFDIQAPQVNHADQAVAEFLGQYYDPADLSTWFQLFSIQEQKVAGVYGPNNASLPGGEATLDIEFIMGMTPQSPTYFWSFAGSGQNPDNQEPFLEWLKYLNDDNSAPLVHSISYADEENGLTPEYMTRVDQEFQKAGLRGLTLIFSAGDDGAGGVALRNASYHCTRFSPSFPPSSPSVTAIGGTQLSNNFSADALPITQRLTNAGVPVTMDMQGERVSSTTTGSRITTGGGFSDLFPAPAYQLDAVKQYLADPTIPSAQWFNKSGRAYPDISSMATNYLVYLKGEVVPIGGTSASAPVIASLVTLLNTVSLRNGGAPLGFLNPLLYQLAANYTHVFTDITLGDNACSVYPTQCCPVGYPAAKGWDATTGLGTPVFSALYDVFNQIKPPQAPTNPVQHKTAKQPGGQYKRMQ